MHGDLSPILNSRVNNCQTRRWTKASRGERAGPDNRPAPALWPLDRGYMTSVIQPPPAPPLLSQTHTYPMSSSSCHNQSVTNCFNCACRLCTMSNSIGSDIALVGLAGCLTCWVVCVCVEAAAFLQQMTMF